MRRVSVFGSTGSVGQNTVELIARRGEDFHVVALSGGSNVAVLAKQARLLHPEVAVVAHDDLLDDLRTALQGTDVRVAAGRKALVDAAAIPVDWAMCAVVGFAGLEISLALGAHSSTLALANKESLVCGGALLQSVCAKHDTLLLPVDSEHSAIFQCIAGAQREVERIVLTASGGPFLNATQAAMEQATPEQAMAHPNWDMGQRISIDSASMFNKAMEVFEAHVLFPARPEQIEVIVHPQSIIHSMVGFVDGAILAHLGPPDMRAPIGFALNWPKRVDLPVERLDFSRLGSLTFEHLDRTQFPALDLVEQTMQMGGLAGAVFNGAKESALDMFLAGKIGFLDMARTVRAVLDVTDAPSNEDVTLAAIVAADQEARAKAAEVALKKAFANV